MGLGCSMHKISCNAIGKTTYSSDFTVHVTVEAVQDLSEVLEYMWYK